MDGTVFFNARRFRLTNHLHVHVWIFSRFKLRVAGDKGNLQHNRVAGRDCNHLARNFREFQAARRKPRQLALVASRFQVGEDRSDGHIFLDSAYVCCTRQGIAAGTVGGAGRELQEFIQLAVGQAVTDVPALIIRDLASQVFLHLVRLRLRRALGGHGPGKVPESIHPLRRRHGHVDFPEVVIRAQVVGIQRQNRLVGFHGSRIVLGRHGRRGARKVEENRGL